MAVRAKSLLVAAIMAGAGFTALGPAQAALSQCDTNNMCAWGNNDYKWLIKERPHGSSTWSAFTGDTNNEMDSWANRSATYTGCQAADSDGGGDRQTMARNSSDGNVAPWNSDEVSAMRTKGGC